MYIMYIYIDMYIHVHYVYIYIYIYTENISFGCLLGFSFFTKQYCKGFCLFDNRLICSRECLYLLSKEQTGICTKC